MIEKSLLREEMRLLVKKFCADENLRKEKSQIACDIFLSSHFYKNAELIFAFCSMPTEIETRTIIESALRDGKSIAVPRVVPNTNDMDFFLLDNTREISEQLVSGEFGIHEPRADLQMLDVSQILKMSECAGNNLQKTVFLVPCLAFDKNGARLGKGKGFYDKYFTRLANASLVANESASCNAHQANISQVGNELRLSKFLRIGFCFPFQIVEKVPCDEHDIRVTHIISDNIIMCC